MNEPYLESKHDPFFNLEEISKLSNLDDVYVNTGIKRMKAYTSPISKEELNKKIHDFWDSRIDNDKETWEILRSCCNYDTDAGWFYLL